jgi:hypothetical protein
VDQLRESKLIVDKVNTLVEYMNKERAEQSQLLKDPFYGITILRIKFADLDLRCRFDNTTLESDYSKSLEVELNKIMKLYKNFGQVPAAFKLSFLSFFTFYKKKLELAMRSMSDDLEQNRLYALMFLNGIVRFNHALRDDALTQKFHEMLAHCHRAAVETNTPDVRRTEAVFEHFFSLANNEKKDKSERYLSLPQLEFVLKAWQTGDLIPRPQLLENLMYKLGKY